MWRAAATVRRTLRQPLWTRNYTQKVEIIPAQRRLTTILVSFAAGASIYLFLPDPNKPAPAIDKLPLAPYRFTPTMVLSNQDVGPNTKLLRLAVPPYAIPQSTEPIWSVFIKDDDIQVERPYTPLYGIDEKGHMLFWIKKYPKGEVGRWLHGKRPGSHVEIRGPTPTWPWKNEDWDEIVMISGGTGITPFVQLFNSMISKENNEKLPKFTLIHGSPTPQELPPSVILKPLVDFSSQQSDKFNIHLFVDSDDGSKPTVPTVKVVPERLSEHRLKEILGLNPPPRTWVDSILRRPVPEPPKSRRLYLVCGPEGMISAVAGPYGRNFSQGPVGGILANLGVTSKEVYKL